MLATVRMKRLLFVLVPWMAMTAAAWGQTRSAELFFTYFGSISDHVFRVGDECYVTPATLRNVGWTVEEREGSVTVRVDARSARIGVRNIAGQPMVPLNEILDGVGLNGQWEPGTNRYDVLSPLISVRYEHGKLSIDAGLPIKSAISTLKNPVRTVIELTGAKLLPETKLVLQDASRISQYRPNVVRVVIGGSVPNPVLPSSAEVSKSYEASLGTTADPSTVVTPSQDEDPPINGIPVSQVATPPVFAGAPVAAGPLSIARDDQSAAHLVLPISGTLATAPSFRRPDPTTIEIVLPNTNITVGDQETPLTSMSIESATTRTENGSGILSLKLVRPMGVEFSFNQGALQIQLLKPNVGDGKLAGKIVVIDPGHGGKDSGATTPARELMEKNMTLAIAKLASQDLAQEGATVIMTRKTDEFIPLPERSEIANRNHADFFISIHINANGLDTSSRGGITFYHLKDPICQVLADCIQSQIKLVSGLPNLGTWSDGKIYKTSGFAVLRYAKMPAVLIECGFINNAADRKRMMTDDFKESIASGIVAGLKVYLGQK